MLFSHNSSLIKLPFQQVSFNNFLLIYVATLWKSLCIVFVCNLSYFPFWVLGQIFVLIAPLPGNYFTLNVEWKIHGAPQLNDAAVAHL